MNAALAPLHQFWSQRQPRERTALLAGGAVLAVALLYGLVVAPIAKDRARLATALPQLRADSARFARDLAQAKGISAPAAGAVDFKALAQGAGLPASTTIATPDSKHASASGKGILWTSVAQLLADTRSQGWTLSRFSVHTNDGGNTVDLDAEWTR